MAEKVELAEQIPLKTDTDANEPIVAEGGDVEVGQVIPEKSTAEKKKIFFWKKVTIKNFCFPKNTIISSL
uniref:Uncharacterized protein n=1 Tax=Panagrolaimus davidi TaxID=227884 RepID=A0A914QZL0_9BILA